MNGLQVFAHEGTTAGEAPTPFPLKLLEVKK